MSVEIDPEEYKRIMAEIEKTDKLRLAEAEKSDVRLCTCIIDYSATGEGRHVWLGIFRAKDEAEAKKYMRKSFKEFDDPGYWNYFSIGFEYFAGLPKDRLGEWFPGDLSEWLKSREFCGPKLFLSFDMNCS